MRCGRQLNWSMWCRRVAWGISQAVASCRFDSFLFDSFLFDSFLFDRAGASVWIGWFVLAIGYGMPAASLADEPSDKPLVQRVPWTTSRIVGSPDPPLALAIQPAFPRLQFQDPMQVRWEPALRRYFLCELNGKVWSFPHDEDIEHADLVVDFPLQLKSFDPSQSHGAREVYSLVFDPDFATNRYVYVCLIFSNATGEPWDHGSRISRFTVDQSEPPTIDVESELPILTWLLGGHNGCDLAFDRSGCLLISTGDATDPSPPDRLQVGQDLGNLLASILRIDVRGATSEQPYRIPTDNPFRDLPGARPEVWAYGFRNPWRIAADSQSDWVWVGDVGWEKWEMIHQVQAGGNYGWSVREGFELIQPDAKVGPTPILPPRVVLSHSESASITGGYVYRGQRLGSVADHYLFGDWVNGRIWAVPADRAGDEFLVASGLLRVVALVPDRDGEPLVVNHFAPTSLFRLVANPTQAAEPATAGSDSHEPTPFPTRLSETGIFQETSRQLPNPGVIRFEINQPMWQDGATAQYWLGLPHDSQVRVFDHPQALENIAMFNSRLHFPDGAVLAKTLSWQDRPIETQVLHFDGRLWHGYSYVWNENASDAELAPASGMELELASSSGRRWTIHSRSECLQCHNPWAEYALAFTPEQLIRQGSVSDVTNPAPHATSSLDWQSLVAQGYVTTLDGERKVIPAERVVRRALTSTGEDLDARARSYLHVNCAHCHQFGAGTGVALSLRMFDEPAAMNCFDVRPEKGQFEIPDSDLIRSGDPLRSILLLRMASLTTGRMPHIGAREVDFAGVDQIARWVRQLPHPLPESNPVSPRTPQEDSGGSQELEIQQALRWALELAERRAGGQSESADELAKLQQLIAMGSPMVSSLLEPFLPPHQRVRRLGPLATYGELSGLTGDVDAGRRLFFDNQGLQCAICHRMAASNAEEPWGIGPDLSSIGRQMNRFQMFEAIVDPSRQIAPEFQGQTILRIDGTVVTGLIAEEDAGNVVIRTANGERIRIPHDDIEQRQVATQSLMPSGLSQQLTAQEMADLLEFLAAQITGPEPNR